MATQSPQLITTVPLTAEAREQLLIELLANDLPHTSELFIPGRGFYIGGTSHAQARHMLKNLCVWLGIKPGYIGLEFESHPADNAPGHKYLIFLESRVLRDELLLGATLAHALVRYLLEERKQIHLPDPHEQLSLIATGTVVCGLGVVILNGLRPGRSHEKNQRELLDLVPLSEYAVMFSGFLHQHSVPHHAFASSLAPWAAKLLHMPKPKKPIPIIRQQYHELQQKRFEKIGLAWVLILAVSLGGFVFAQRVEPQTTEYHELQQKVNLLTDLEQLCRDTVAHTKQYVDTSDLMQQRAVRAEELRCKSLGNQLRGAKTELDKLE